MPNQVGGRVGQASRPVQSCYTASISYAFGPVPQLDTVELDTAHGCEFLDAEAQLEKYRSVLDRMEGSALKPDVSRDLIHRIAQEI